VHRTVIEASIAVVTVFAIITLLGATSVGIPARVGVHLTVVQASIAWVSIVPVITLFVSTRDPVSAFAGVEVSFPGFTSGILGINNK
jgi:hypothetical protein